MEDKKRKQYLKVLIPICLMVQVTFMTTPYNLIKCVCILLLNAIISFLIVISVINP